MMPHVRDALLRTLAFHETWGHAPTRPEWAMTLDGHSCGHADVMQEIAGLEADGTVLSRYGRYAFPVGAQFIAPGSSGRPEGVMNHAPTLIDRLRENELYAPRKRRAAQRVARWLARLSSVRFVALCNTTALGHARDEGDLDFFVVARAGTIMQTRGLAALPFKLFGRRPGRGDERDAVCLSYFVGDDGLDLGPHMLEPDDPYFRYWFLSLLPLYDDGVSESLWRANAAITSRHPCARPWMVPPDFRVVRPSLRIPIFPSFERMAANAQIRAFPPAIRDLMNRDRRVIVNDNVLKFHVEDGREEYRRRYHELCHARGVSA